MARNYKNNNNIIIIIIMPFIINIKKYIANKYINYAKKKKKNSFEEC